jgi:AcrR family transcriptional regulator
MREVAERSEVALGTLYRYFPSKIHLLVSAMKAETDRLAARLSRRQVPGDTRAERVSFVLERSTRSLQRDPLLTEAMIRALMAADASVAGEVSAVRQGMSDLIVAAIRGEDAPTDHDEELAAILQDVWFARQIAWLGGRIGAADVWRDIHTAITLVLAD